MTELTYKSTYPPIPNSRDVAATTRGIARQLNPLRDVELYDGAALPPGGGDLNGTAAPVIMLGQSGTAAAQIAVPRRPHMSANNYTGIV